MHRRRFLRGVVATGAVIAAPTGEASAAEPGSTPDAEAAEATGVDPAGATQDATPSAPAPWALLDPLSVGSDVGLGWRIEHLSEIVRGAAVLTLVHEAPGEGGERARVHLCAVRGEARGVAHSEHVDLILMNRGDGGLVTNEPIGRVLKTLAGVIRANERGSTEGLMPHALRVSYFHSLQCLN